MKKIPYGISDFYLIQTENYYFTDKTKFIEELENDGLYQMFLRPRRFGKSLFVAILDAYYNISYKNDFKKLFGDTYIGKKPTKEQGSYFILKFDFSIVSIEDVNDRFTHYIKSKLESFIKSYKLDIELESHPKDTFNNILIYFQNNHTKKLYILIDEYDHFANRLLIQDKPNYKGIVTDKTAFFKEFFTMLKAGASGNNAPIKRMFITGVTPMTMYDVTSGFNIGRNLSTNYKFNDTVGFTQSELEEIFNHYDIPKHYLEDMKVWYNNYRFNQDIKHTIYNTDMILYFVKYYIDNHSIPDDMIDINVRSDYSRLRYLIYTNNKLNGNFETLQLLLSKNEMTTNSIVQDFSALNLKDSDNFKSLLFYLGLVTIKDKKLNITLQIPNETIKRIDIDFLKESLKLENIFSITSSKINDTLAKFATDGSLEVFKFLAKNIKEQSNIRDYIKGEHHIKAIYLAYLSLSNYYITKTEAELNKGFADLFLIPFNPYVKYLALVELKYIKRGDKLDILPTLIDDATTQLNTYEKDSMVLKHTKKGLLLKKIILVFHGWELIKIEEI